MPAIIVVQTSSHAFLVCRNDLEKMGLEEGIDFLLLDHEPNLEDFIPGTRQILITGSFCGSHKGLAEMVQAARDRNKDLVTVGFSLDKLEGPFDESVIKNRREFPDQFSDIVRRFQSGDLVRTEASWAPPKLTGFYSL